MELFTRIENAEAAIQRCSVFHSISTEHLWMTASENAFRFGATSGFLKIFCQSLELMFSKSIIFVACPFKELTNFFTQSYSRYKLCLFSIWSNAPTVGIDIRREYVFLFLLLKTFLDYFYSYLFFKLKIQCQHI